MWLNFVCRVCFRRCWWSEPCWHCWAVPGNTALTSQAMLWTNQGTDSTEVDLFVVGVFTQSKWSLLISTALLDLRRELFFFFHLSLWTELSLDFSQPCKKKKKKKGKRNCKWQWVNIYNTCHYLTQNSNIRAPFCWKADGNHVSVRVRETCLFFRSVFSPFGCVDFWMFPESLNACAE